MACSILTSTRYRRILHYCAWRIERHPHWCPRKIFVAALRLTTRSSTRTQRASYRTALDESGVSAKSLRNNKKRSSLTLFSHPSPKFHSIKLSCDLNAEHRTFADFLTPALMALDAIVVVFNLRSFPNLHVAPSTRQLPRASRIRVS